MNRRSAVGALILVIIVAGGAWWYATRIYVSPFPIDPADTISSWSFKGAYSGNPVLEERTRSDMAHLKGLMGVGTYPDYQLFIGLADDAELLGDGKGEYAYLNNAIHIDSAHGLVYVNLGHLMDELGAYHTARAAYARAVAVEPGQIVYQEDRLLFLTERFPQDIAGNTAAFAEATKQFGVDADILQIEAPWLASIGRIADAITAWKNAETLAPSRKSAIDAEIAKLSKQLP